MKITKQRLKDIIKEELDAMRGAERPGAGIEDIAASEEEEVIDRAFGSPEERLLILIKAREALGKMTRDELKDLSMSLDAPMFATLLHILGNPMYAPMGGQYHDQGHEMELEEERGAYSSSRYAKRADGSEPGEQSANLKYRGGPEAAQSQKRIKNYRTGATGKRNQGRGGY